MRSYKKSLFSGLFNKKLSSVERNYTNVLNLIHPPKTPFSISIDADVINYMMLMNLEDIVNFSMINKYCYKIAQIGLRVRMNEWSIVKLNNQIDVIRNLKSVCKTTRKIIRASNKVSNYPINQRLDASVEIIKENKLEVLFGHADNSCKGNNRKFKLMVLDILLIKSLTEEPFPEEYDYLLCPKTWKNIKGGYSKFLSYFL